MTRLIDRPMARHKAPAEQVAEADARQRHNLAEFKEWLAEAPAIRDNPAVHEGGHRERH